MPTLRATFSSAVLPEHPHGDFQPRWKGRLGKMRGMRTDNLAQLDPGRWRPRPRCTWRTRDGLNELSIPSVFHWPPRDGTGLDHFATRESNNVGVRVAPIPEDNDRQNPRAHVAFCIMLWPFEGCVHRLNSPNPVRRCPKALPRTRAHAVMPSSPLTRAFCNNDVCPSSHAVTGRVIGSLRPIRPSRQSFSALKGSRSRRTPTSVPPLARLS